MILDTLRRMNNGPILISSDSDDSEDDDDDLDLVVINSWTSPTKARKESCDIGLGLGLPDRHKATPRPRLCPKLFKNRPRPTAILGPIIVISDDDSDRTTGDECVVSSDSESTKENQFVDDLLDITFDDINDETKPQNMETSPITPFMERHTLSPQNFLKTNNKFSPIKRSETLKGSINNNSRTIKCIKPFRNLNIKQVWHHLSKKTKDQLSKISNEVIVLSHNQHSQLLSSALPTHLNNDFYRDVQRPHMNDVQNQTVEMSNIHNNIIEGHQEEEVHSEAITYIHDFTTTDIYPEKQCLKYLLDTLVAVGSRDLTCQTYKTLKHIQNHHKLTRKDFSEDWNQIMDILKPLETECNILFYRNRLLYLDLLTSVLEEDLNKHKLRNTTAQSFLCKMLSPDHEMANLASLSLCLLSVLQRTFDNSSDMFLEEGIQRSLLLLQKILTLSVEVSKSRPEGAMKIAEHLLYPFRNLSKVEHRSQLLETMQSNLLRIKLIELWLENCCVVRDVCIPTSGDPISINKILNRHFRCTPSSTVEDASVACEELAMMLYLLLKSYLAYNAEKIHPNATDNASCYCGLKLSREESTLFLTMGDVVTKLRNHLSSYGELTTKTLAYLSYIESLQDLVDI